MREWISKLIGNKINTQGNDRDRINKQVIEWMDN